MLCVGAVCGVVWCRGLLCVGVCVLVCGCVCLRMSLCVSVCVSVLVCVVCGLVWCVLCVVCGCVWLCVVVCGMLFVVVWHAENPHVCIQHVPVCAFKTFPCVPATCPHEKKHVGMLPVHTGTF